MKKILLIIALTICINSTYGQSEKLNGSWLITKVELDDKVQEPFFIINFRDDGIIEALEMEIGTWNYDVAENKIVMKSGFDKNFDGESKILKLTENELIVDKDGEKVYYLKIDYDKIYLQNEASNLAGIWNIQNDEGATMILKFDAPDAFIFVNATSGTAETVNGTWIFDPEENTVIIIGFTKLLKGINKIIKLTENELILENNGNIIKARKEKSGSNNIERLTFNYEDIEFENNNKYQLPWIDFNKMIQSLEDANYLKYKMGKLVETSNTLKYVSIVSMIEVKPDVQSVVFTNLEVSEGDSLQFSQNYKDGVTQTYNNFFPMDKPDAYKIIAVKKLNFPAGVFECTIVEGFEGDTKVKYWMINDQPGVYARIIKDGVSVFGDMEYSVMDLLEIK
jgi:hypothetical protein